MQIMHSWFGSVHTCEFVEAVAGVPGLNGNKGDPGECQFLHIKSVWMCYWIQKFDIW